MSDIGKIKDRIRKLLNVAEDDAATDGEIENAMRAAQSLMAAYKLTEADCPADTARPTTYGEQRCYAAGSNLSNWESYLMHFCCDFVRTAQFYYCHGVAKVLPSGIVQRDDTGAPICGTRITVYGPTEDVAIAVELFQELQQTIIAMARLRYGGVFRGDGRAYAEGFAHGLRERLRVVQRQLQAPAAGGNGQAGTALMVRVNAIAQQQRDEGSQWLKQQGVTLRSGRRSGNYNDPGAFARGRAAGKAADVSAGRRSGPALPGGRGRQ